jgi:hypothetical protein
MALQIRRGTTAERLAITFLPGEIVFDTTLNQVFIGDGETSGGSPVTAYTDENAIDAVGAALVAGVHQNISFTYGTTQDGANRIDATVTLDGGLLEVVDDTSPELGGDLDLNTNMIAGVGDIDITGSITASLGFSGDLTGNVTGDVSGSAATVTEEAQPTITSVGTLVSLDVTGAITGDSFEGDVITNSITAAEGDLTISPTTNFSNGIEVTSGDSTLGNTTITGQATVNLPTGVSTTINADDSLTTGARPVALVLDATTLDFEFSGPAIEFKVNDGTLTAPLVKIEAYSQPDDLPGFNIKVYNSGTSGYDIVPFRAYGGGITVGGGINMNDELFLRSSGAPTSSKGEEGDEVGAVVIDNQYIYRCVATYTDGLADIWARVAFVTTPW